MSCHTFLGYRVVSVSRLPVLICRLNWCYPFQTTGASQTKTNCKLCVCVHCEYHCVPLLTSFHHPHFITLSEAACLAALPTVPVDGTLVGRRAHVVIVTWKKTLLWSNHGDWHTVWGYLTERNTLYCFFIFLWHRLNSTVVSTLFYYHETTVFWLCVFCCVMSTPSERHEM